MRWSIILFLTTITVSAGAEKRVSVTQLERQLTADVGAHKPDAIMIRQLGDMELTERLTDAALDSLEGRVLLGSTVKVALQLLADKSVFLDPPSKELPEDPAPDPVAQQQMLDDAHAYVAQTLSRLPNLMAIETTQRFDDTPEVLRQGEWPTRTGLHLVDTSRKEITIRQEQANDPADNAEWQDQKGLTSLGEFGSTLAMVLADTLHGKVSWAHWEATETGKVAVFHYTIPRSESHFEIISSQQRQAQLEGHATPGTGLRGTAGIGIVPSGLSSSNATIMKIRPGYHGSLWVAAANGAIVRLTIEAETKQSADFRKAALMVQYGPVEIGGSTFICPVRSLALSATFANAEVIAGEQPTQWLNETLFTTYHRFGSTIRILPDETKP